MKKNDTPIQAQCVSEEEMRKELELYLIEKLWIGELLLKAYDEWKKDWYDEWYNEWYEDWAYSC